MLPETQSRPRVLVVGGGLAGMAAALELAVRARVSVIERLPAMGGTWGFEHPRARELAAALMRFQKGRRAPTDGALQYRYTI